MTIDQRPILAALWRIGDALFAIATRRVVEIIPIVHARPIGASEPWLLGIVDHRGWLVPLVDPGPLLGHPCARLRLHSRILVVAVDAPPARPATIGLLAEDLVGTEWIADLEGSRPEAPRGGTAGEPARLAMTRHGVARVIEPRAIFSPEQWLRLPAAPEEACA